MFISYAHLTGADIDREICKLYGIEPTTTQVTGDALEPKICPHCKEMNSPISRHCHICGHGLDGATIESDDEFLRYANANPKLLINYLEKYAKNM
jgi:integrase/recombinase XerD